MGSTSVNRPFPTVQAVERLARCFSSTNRYGQQNTQPRCWDIGTSASIERHSKRTFHFSISSCFNLYCLTSSSRVFLSPSELVFRIGTTSFTVLSVRTPLIIRKHFRSPGSGSKVSSTSLDRVSMTSTLGGIRSGEKNRKGMEIRLHVKMTRKEKRCMENKY